MPAEPLLMQVDVIWISIGLQSCADSICS